MASTPERDPRGGRLRASDADRDRVAAVLRQHCAAGRLTLEELADRLEQAYEARTLDQLFALTNDMPDPEPHPHLAEHLPDLRTVVPARRGALAVDVASFAVFSAVLVGVWAATGTTTAEHPPRRKMHSGNALAMLVGPYSLLPPEKGGGPTELSNRRDPGGGWPLGRPLDHLVNLSQTPLGEAVGSRSHPMP